MLRGIVLLCHLYAFSSVEAIFSGEETPDFLRKILEKKKKSQSFISNVLEIVLKLSQTKRLLDGNIDSPCPLFFALVWVC